MATAFTFLFVTFLLLMVGIKFWLATRQIRHVTLNADIVPMQFAERVALEAHQKAAAYTVARQRLGMIESGVGAVVLLVLTLMGGLQIISGALSGWFGHGFLYQLLLVGAVVLLVSVIDLPFA